MVRLVRETRHKGVPPSTESGLRSAWKYWTLFLRQFYPRTSPWRDGRDANSGRDPVGYERETFLVSHFIIWSHLHSVKARGRLVPQPKSSLNRAVAVMRCHTARGIRMIPTSAVADVLKGLHRKYVEEHGPEGLFVRHKQPFTRN